MCRTAFFAVVLGLFPFAIAPARAATPEEVDAALARAKKFIYAQQKDDNFEQKMNEPWVQQTGHTALAVYALLAAGESHQDPRIAKAIEYLKKTETKGVYATGVRCLVWNALPPTDDVKAVQKKDLNYLLANVIKEGRGKGFYDYMGGGKSYSHSRAQYAVLGVWACAQSGLECRDRTGTWSRRRGSPTRTPRAGGGRIRRSRRTSGTASRRACRPVGVATLFITQDFLHPNEGIGCRGNTKNAPIERGMKYMIDNFDKIGTSERYSEYDFPYATLYAVERIGVASGQKYFGTNDWYQKGADWLLKVQTKSGKNEGMWFAPKTLCTPLHDTCFGTLFLARGRAAVAVNKLEYANADGKPGNWNQRPRDVANLVRWTGRAAERDLNWQIVNLQVPAKELHDAPILYISGNQELAIPDEQKAKIKSYVEGGGMLLANPDCGDAKFTASFRKLASELFPGYEFRELPDKHPIYTEQQFLREKWKNKPSVLGLSNGVRELALILRRPTPARRGSSSSSAERKNSGSWAPTSFNTRSTRSTSEQGRDPHRHARREDQGRQDDQGRPRRLRRQLEPRARRLASSGRLDAQHEKTDLDVTVAKLGKDKLTDAKVVHLTGTTPFTLDPASQVELRNVINAGGTLVIDAAGGSSEFADSAERLLPLLFPGEKLQVLPPEHDVFKIGTTKLGDVAYRTFARKSPHEWFEGPQAPSHRKRRPRPLLLQPRRSLRRSRRPTRRRHPRLRPAHGDGDHVQDHPLRGEMKRFYPRRTRRNTNEDRKSTFSSSCHSCHSWQHLFSPFARNEVRVTDEAWKPDNGRTRSVWMATADTPTGPKLAEDEGTDVCIVGAGHRGAVGRISPDERRQARRRPRRRAHRGGEDVAHEALTSRTTTTTASRRSKACIGEEVLRVSTQSHKAAGRSHRADRGGREHRLRLQAPQRVPRSSPPTVRDTISSIRNSTPLTALV
jgi:hypothetical protein